MSPDVRTCRGCGEVFARRQSDFLSPRRNDLCDSCHDRIKKLRALRDENDAKAQVKP